MKKDEKLSGKNPFLDDLLFVDSRDINKNNASLNCSSSDDVATFDPFASNQAAVGDQTISNIFLEVATSDEKSTNSGFDKFNPFEEFDKPSSSSYDIFDMAFSGSTPNASKSNTLVICLLFFYIYLLLLLLS